ncbi:MAG: hypothetical protein MRJ67_00295 [Nitrospirales bacterium]|nr:hypothetical protein [Nitrospirales bacterium]
MGNQRHVFGHPREVFSYKIHSLGEAAERLFQFCLAGDEAAACKAYEALKGLTEKSQKH